MKICPATLEFFVRTDGRTVSAVLIGTPYEHELAWEQSEREKVSMAK
jgi:hypothetical protein